MALLTDTGTSLRSPANNTGWGLGIRRLYGGARVRSEEHPVRVRQHYRAPWGSKKGKGPNTRKTPRVIAEDIVQEEAIVEPPTIREEVLVPEIKLRPSLKRKKTVTFHPTVLDTPSSPSSPSKRKKRKIRGRLLPSPSLALIRRALFMNRRRGRKKKRTPKRSI